EPLRGDVRVERLEDPSAGRVADHRVVDHEQVEVVDELADVRLPEGPERAELPRDSQLRIEIGGGLCRDEQRPDPARVAPRDSPELDHAGGPVDSRTASSGGGSRRTTLRRSPPFSISISRSTAAAPISH